MRRSGGRIPFLSRRQKSHKPPIELAGIPTSGPMIGTAKNTLDASRVLFAFWSRIARTVAIAFAVLLAIPFVLGSLRSSGAGTRTMMGLMLGISFFLLQRLIESGTIVFDLNPLVLAWIPTATMGIVTLLLLARAR